MRFLSPYQPAILSAVRIVTAYMFMLHGTAKVFGWPTSMGGGFEWASLMGAAAALELAGGALLLLGLFTRPVAFLLSGHMAVAYFMFHAKAADWLFPIANHGESAVLFCFIFLYFSAAGGGCFAIDHARRKK